MSTNVRTLRVDFTSGEVKCPEAATANCGDREPIPAQQHKEQLKKNGRVVPGSRGSKYGYS